MALVNDETAQVRFSNDMEVASIRVKALFGAITKARLDVYPKTLTLQNLKIPLHRFGTWIFELSNSQDKEKDIAFNMGPIGSFIWGMRQSYPEISVWVDDPSKCSFVLEFEKGKQTQYLNEIASLRVKLQEQLKEIGDLELKFIKITPNESTPSKVIQQTSRQQVAGAVGDAQSVETMDHDDLTAENSQLSTETIWKCRKLKGDIEGEKDAVQKLLLQIELALFLYDLGKTDDVAVLTDEIKGAIPEIDSSQEKSADVLKNLRELSELYENDDKLIESTEILIHSVALVHKFDDQDDRLYHMNTDVVKICETLAKMYKVKPTCIQASVGEDDEIGRPRQSRRSRTAFSQAKWLDQKGNRALKHFKFTEALSSFHAAARLQPKEARYRLNKADVYLAKGQFKSCKKECGKALALDINNKEKGRALELLGEVDYRSYRASEALDLFKKSKSSEETTSITTKINLLEEDFKVSRGGAAIDLPVVPLDYDDYLDDYDDYGRDYDDYDDYGRDYDDYADYGRDYDDYDDYGHDYNDYD